jgi:hypothetical protein
MYGLTVEANYPIFGLDPCTLPAAVPDLRIQLGVLPGCLEPFEAGQAPPWYISSLKADSGVPVLRIWGVSGGRLHRLLYADGTEFVIDSNGTRIWGWWPDTLSLEGTATYLLGPVMGLVLLLRGIVCLHASAIAVEGRAIAIAGPAEAGKSTTAAVFAGLGYPVLSDDVVTLDEHAGIFVVHPAYPLIRLWPESVEALYGSVDALPRLTPSWDKCYLDLTRDGYRFERGSLPLAAIYVLDERSTEPAAPRIEELPGRAALMSLVANTYATRLMDSGMRAHEFDLLSRVVASTPVRRVVPHAEVTNLPRLCDLILEDARVLTQSTGGPTGA